MAIVKNLSLYTKPSKILHWVIAAIVITMLSLSFFLEDVPTNYQSQAYLLHKSFGLTVLALMILRITWIAHAGRPTLPVTVAHWQKLLSRTVQYSFYVLLILMPLSGWIMSCAANHIPSYFGLFSVPLPAIPLNQALAGWMDQVHSIIAWILIVLVVLHVLGALKHHFIDQDGVLGKMWF